jgi:hypothetical protein
MKKLDVNTGRQSSTCISSQGPKMMGKRGGGKGGSHRCNSIRFPFQQKNGLDGGNGMLENMDANGRKY